MRSNVRILYALAICLLAAGSLHAATLSGSAFSPSPANVDLSAEGSVDWVHWGKANSSDVNRKNGGGSQFSALSVFNEGINVPATGKARLTNSASKFSWSDGTPSATASNIPNGVYTNNFDGPGRGFVFTVPADLLQRVLKVYVGEYTADGTLQASLSDSSAPIYTDTLTGLVNGTRQAVYTINYAAASAGQTLTIKWKETNDLGDADNVTIQGATLQIAFVPEPATLTLLSAGLLLLAARRRSL